MPSKVDLNWVKHFNFKKRSNRSRGFFGEEKGQQRSGAGTTNLNKEQIIQTE